MSDTLLRVRSLARAMANCWVAERTGRLGGRQLTYIEMYAIREQGNSVYDALMRDYGEELLSAAPGGPVSAGRETP